MKLKVLIVSVATVIAGHGAMAGEIKVPANAEKLDAAGITDLYDGAYAFFDNKQNRETLTGDIFYDLKKQVMFGTYNWNNENKGLFRGKTWVKGDEFCNKPEKGKETCTSVYLDGKTYYEVDKSGQVVSVDTLYDNPPKLPQDATRVSVEEVLKLLKGKKVFFAVFDFPQRVVVNVKYDVKRKKAIGSAIAGGDKEKKLNVAYTVKDDRICWPDNTGKEACYDHYQHEGAIYLMNPDGNLHAIGKIQ